MRESHVARSAALSCSSYFCPCAIQLVAYLEKYFGDVCAEAVDHKEALNKRLKLNHTTFETKVGPLSSKHGAVCTVELHCVVPAALLSLFFCVLCALLTLH